MTVTSPAQIQAVKPKPFPTPKPLPREAAWELTSFSYVPIIAPGAEDPKPLIRWTYRDPQHQIREAHIRLFRPGNEIPLRVLDLNLAAIEEGSYPWDGQVYGGFRYGYVTCEYSEYRLQFVLEGEGGDGEPQTRDVTFRVEPTELTLGIGPRSLLSRGRELEVYDYVFTNLNTERPPDPKTIRSLPTPNRNGVVRVPLRSNIFSTSWPAWEQKPPIDDELASSPESFIQYERLWGNGPAIPLVAAVFFRSSRGDTVLAPKAWGARRVLFSWEEQSEALGSIANDSAREYIDNARAYKDDEPEPAGGRLCHVDRGGKRSKDGRPAVFESDGASTFRVRSEPKLVTSAWAEPVQNYDLAGYAGVVFRPPRQSGETLRVSARFDPSPMPGLETEGSLNLAAAAFSQSTPYFQVWRAVHVVRQILKSYQPPSPQRNEEDSARAVAVAPVDVPQAAAHFESAYLELQDRVLAPKTISEELVAKQAPGATYNEAIREQVATLRAEKKPVGSNRDYSDFLAADNVLNADADHEAAAEAVVVYRPMQMFARFKEYLLASGKKLPEGADTYFDMKALWNPPLAHALWPGRQYGMGEYYQEASDYALTALVRAIRRLFPEYDVQREDPDTPYDPLDQWPIPRGISIFVFDSIIGRDSKGHSLAGLGGDTVPRARAGGLVLIFRAIADDHESGVVAHECGHALFLPHRNSGEDGADALAHDPLDQTCLMGYPRPKDPTNILDLWQPDHFCGLCLLRLRGWDHRALIRSLRPGEEL